MEVSRTERQSKIRRQKAAGEKIKVDTVIANGESKTGEAFTLAAVPA